MLRYGTCSQGISQFYLHTHTFIRNRNEPYLPLPSQPQLVLIYRPRRDGRLSYNCSASVCIVLLVGHKTICPGPLRGFHPQHFPTFPLQPLKIVLYKLGNPGLVWFSLISCFVNAFFFSQSKDYTIGSVCLFVYLFVCHRYRSNRCRCISLKFSAANSLYNYIEQGNGGILGAIQVMILILDTE